MTVFLLLKSKLGFGDNISETRLPNETIQYTVDATTIARDITGWNSFSSFTVSILPVVGDVKDVQEAVTGVDLITGVALTSGEQVITVVCVFLPVISGKEARVVKKGFIKKATEAVAEAITEVEKFAPLLKTERNIVFFWSGRTNGIGGAEKALEIAESKGGTTLENIITVINITLWGSFWSIIT